MSDRKSSPQDDHRRRLKEHLRRLSRISAPWYFESELQQRLHPLRHRRGPTRIAPVPLPGFAVLTMAVLALVVISYYIFIPTIGNAPSQQQKGEGETKTAPQVLSPEAPAQAPVRDEFQHRRKPKEVGAEEPGRPVPASDTTPEPALRQGRPDLVPRVAPPSADYHDIADSSAARSTVKRDSALPLRDSVIAQPDTLKKPRSK